MSNPIKDLMEWDKLSWNGGKPTPIVISEYNLKRVMRAVGMSEAQIQEWFDALQANCTT